jgi:outer membrane protein TolC
VEYYRKSIDVRTQQLAALDAAVDAASKLFQAARVEYIEVLFAQRDRLDARMALIDTKTQQLAAIVNAYQALGGGAVVSTTPPVVQAQQPQVLPQPQPQP